MNATTPAPRPPIRLEDQVQELQRSTTASRFVMNCGDEPIRAMWSGIPYIIAPGETLEIPARLVHQRTDDNKPMLRKPPILEVSTKGFQSGAPSVIASNLLKIHGAQGLTLITGDDRIDSQRQHQARERYVKNRLERALSVQAEWMQKQEMNAKKPGSLPLVMTARIRAEIQWLREHRAQMQQKRKRYIAFDGFDSDNYDEIVQWLQETYPEEWDSRGEKLITDTTKTATPAAPPEPEREDFAEGFAQPPDETAAIRREAPAPPAPAFLRPPRRTTPAEADVTGESRPGPVARAPRQRRSGYDPDVLRQQVEAAGIELTPEQYEGIDNGDVNVVMDVMQMLQGG